jgi:F0F1-type ATP synthase assembly protein I
MNSACAFFHKHYFVLAMAGSGSVSGSNFPPPGSRAVAGDEQRSDPREIVRASGRHMGLGLAFALSILLFMGGGAWLDSKLGTTPFLMLFGAAVGAGAGFYSLYYHIVIEPRQRENGPQ